jgi:hypothetical protein
VTRTASDTPPDGRYAKTLGEFVVKAAVKTQDARLGFQSRNSNHFPRWESMELVCGDAAATLLESQMVAS